MLVTGERSASQLVFRHTEIASIRPASDSKEKVIQRQKKAHLMYLTSRQ